MISKKTYIPAKPRNRKLVNVSGGGGIGRSDISGVVENSHEHPNKVVIDQILQQHLDVLGVLSIVDGNLKIDANAYSTGELSAYGIGSGGSSGGGVDLLQAWTDYDATKDNWAVKAGLLVPFYTDATSRLSALEGGAALSLSPVGSGNGIANITKSGTVLTVTKANFAELDVNGKIPSSQLPSYVDDVLEYVNLAAFPATGETGKIYIAQDSNKTYRWSGTAYVEISASLALGETSSTAYRGDRGKIAYDHSQTEHQAIINGTGFVKANGKTLSYDNNSYSLASHNHSGVYEPVLGNPSANGYLLSSTTAGARSWVAPYSLPTASASVLGGVKIGANVSIASGVISVHNPLTIGTANGLSLSTQVLSLALATTAANGALSSTDKTYIELLKTFFEYDSTNNAIKALKSLYSTGEVSAYGIGSGGGGGGGGSLSGLSDVMLTSLAANNLLQFNGTHWVNVPASSVGTPVSWGTTSNNTSPLTVSGTTKTVSLSGHLHTGVYEPVFTKNTAFNKNFGTTAGTVAEGNHTHTFASLTNKPTTLAGYEITDAVTTNTTQTITGTKTFRNWKIDSFEGALGIQSYRVGTGMLWPYGNALSAIRTGLGFGWYNTEWVIGNIRGGATDSYGFGIGYKNADGNLDGEFRIAPGGLAYLNNVQIATISSNVASATKLQTARTIAGVSFDGTANIAIPFANLSSKPTTLAGYGITNAYTKTEVDTALDGKLNKSVFDDLFEKVEVSTGVFAIKAKYSFYSTGEVSAYGIGSGGSGGSYERLDAWADYNSTKAGWVLSAFLGNELNTRVGNLEGGSALTVNTTGAGNAITSISKAGTVITATKGATFSLDNHLHAGVYEPVFTKNTAFNKNFGTTAGTVAEGNHTHTFASLTNKPTTLAGYEITDAYTKTEVDTALDGKASLRTRSSMTGSYRRFVIGVIRLDGGADTYSRAFGTITMGRVNGLFPNKRFDFSIQKKYNVEAFEGNVFRYNAFERFRLCKFLYNGVLYGGFDIYVGAANITSIDFIGQSPNWVVVEYYNTSSNTVINSEINNSLVAMNYEAGSFFANGDTIYSSGNLTSLSQLTDNIGVATHIANTSNPHSVTKAQVGLGNVDNTADSAKNVLSASKLSASRTIWGQSFDGTGNVTGALSGATTGSFTGTITSPLYQSGAYNWVSKTGGFHSGIDGQLTGGMSWYDGTGTSANIFRQDNLLVFSRGSNQSLTIDTNSNVSILGYTTTNRIILSSTAAEAQLTFSRPSYNYLTAPLDGGINFITNGDSISALNSMLILSPNGYVGVGKGFTNNTTAITAQLHVRGNILSTGEITAYVASDRRLKHNITPLFSSLDIIDKLNPVSYYWNAKAKELNPMKSDGLDYGLIAQEVENVLPGVVHGIFDDKYKSIDYIKLIPIMIAAIKELKQKVNKL